MGHVRPTDFNARENEVSHVDEIHLAIKEPLDGLDKCARSSV